jgi:hypothetical protein
MKTFRQFVIEARTPAGKEAEKKGLVHLGKGYYSNAKGEIVAKSEMGGQKLVPISKAEKQKVKQGTPLLGPSSISDIPPTASTNAAPGGSASPGAASAVPVQQPEVGEGEGPAVVITFGKFNPPSIGHENLLAAVQEQAEELEAEYRIYPSRISDRKQNPLDFKTKFNIMQNVFPDYAENIIDDPENGDNIYDILQALHDEGYQHVIIVCGDENEKKYEKIAEKYNGTVYDFYGVEIVGAGMSDPDTDKTEGITSSMMRKAALENDYETFKQGIPGNVSKKEARAIYMQVRKSMSLKEELWKIAPSLDIENLREEYYQGNIFNLGECVVDCNTGIDGKIITRGSNYVIFVDEQKKIHRTWIKDLSYHPGPLEIGTDDYRQYVQRMTPGEKIQSFTKAKRKDK